MVSVWRGFLFLWVLGMGDVILLWHSLSLPYNYLSICANHSLQFCLPRSCVRVLKSHRAGVGKSLYAKRRIEQLYRMVGNNENIDVNGGKQTLNDDRIMSIKIPLQEKAIDVDTFCSILLQHTTLPENSFPRIFHIDISYEVNYFFNYHKFCCINM